MAYETKTKATEVDVDGFIAGSAKPADGAVVCALMRKVTGSSPGCGAQPSSASVSGNTSWPAARWAASWPSAFRPAPSLVFYIKHAEGWDERLSRLGKHRTGKGCLYINKLADVDAGRAEDLVAAAWRETAKL